MKPISAIIFLCVMVVLSSARADDLRLNQIQVIGTHNSYHIAPAPALKSIIQASRKGWFEAIDYTHRPLPEQFETLGIRQIELDLFADPNGGLFAKPAARGMAAQGDRGPDPNENGILDKPGTKVLHVQDVDYRTTVPTFAMALKQLRTWSKEHPKHVPIMVLVELKDQAQPLLPTKPVAWTAERMNELDEQILKEFSEESLLLPGQWSKDKWPTLAESRGRVMFVLDNDGKISETYQGLKAPRVLFALRPESDPLAAVFKINDPVGDYDKIQRLVKAGFMVRTRADADTAEARKNDVTRRDKAFASGAQWVSTDFPEARRDISEYVVKFPGGKMVRVNPVTVKDHRGEIESP